jgi:hypothetical protein
LHLYRADNNCKKHIGSAKQKKKHIGNMYAGLRRCKFMCTLCPVIAEQN